MCHLWLHEKVSKGEIEVVKVSTDENVADALTKYVSRENVSEHMFATGQKSRDGRHVLAPATEC